MSGQHQPMVTRAARALSDRAAEICGLNLEDNWKVYSEEYVVDAQVALNAAGVPAMLAALKTARGCILIDRTALADCHTGPDGLDEEGASGVAEYDAALAEINAAIATGGAT